MFRGTSHHSIDAKGRTSLPAEYREILTQRGEDSLFLTQGPENSLWCFTPGHWLEVEAKLLKLSQFKADVRAVIDWLVAPARACPFDKMGRILVPPELRAYAGLQDEVVFAGSLDRIRLWSGERYRQNNERIAGKTVADALENIADLGI